MSVRYICGAVTAVVLTCAPPTVARAQAQGAEILPPDQSGMVTVAGCLQRRDADHKNQYILANPVPGPVDSVTQGTCSATIDERAFDLDKTHKSGMNDSLVGHWIEISGRREYGSTGSATAFDNVEAFAKGAPIFACAGEDTLTGSGANDLFVFAKPIGNDVIYNFNAGSDKIDLIGFSVATFTDVHAI